MGSQAKSSNALLRRISKSNDIAEHFQTLANNAAFQPHDRPDHWQDAVVTMLGKTPQAANLEEFRPISLMPQQQKLYSKWLYAILRPTADRCIPVTQHGFRPRRQAPEIHHLLGKLQEMGKEWRLKYIALKADVRKAFDSLSRAAILEALRGTRAHPRLIWALSRELLTNWLHPQMYGVKSPTPVLASRGAKQGSPETGAFYCLTVAHFTKPIAHRWEQLAFGHRVGPEGQVINHISFADDIQLIAKTPQEMNRMYEDLSAAIAPIGLQINPQKTQYVTNISPDQCERIPGVNKTGVGMMVLGKLFDCQDTTDRDISRKIAGAWAKFRRILPVLKQRSPLRHRFRILQACVLQAILWGAESWHITKRRMAQLRGVHMRMLRYMIPPPGILQGLEIGERTVEHARYVRELLHKQGFDLLDTLWARKYWGWAGHITRLSPSFPASQWHSYRNHKWWKREQKNPWGKRHCEYDANVSRWETPLIRHSVWGQDWKAHTSNRERWGRGFEPFWVSLNAIWHHTGAQKNKKPRSPPREDRNQPQDRQRAPTDSNCSESRPKSPRIPPSLPSSECRENRNPQARQRPPATASRSKNPSPPKKSRIRKPPPKLNRKTLESIGEEEPLSALCQVYQHDHSVS